MQVLEIVSTLPDEVALVWPNKLDVMKIVFLINKYSPLLDATIAITCTSPFLLIRSRFPNTSC